MTNVPMAPNVITLIRMSTLLPLAVNYVTARETSSMSDMLTLSYEAKSAIRHQCPTALAYALSLANPRPPHNSRARKMFARTAARMSTSIHQFGLVAGIFFISEL